MIKLQSPVHAWFSPISARVDGSAYYDDGQGNRIECTEISISKEQGIQQWQNGLEDTRYLGLVYNFVGVANFVPQY